MILREVQMRLMHLWETKVLRYGEAREIYENIKRDARLPYEIAKQHPLFCSIFIIMLIITALSLIKFPYWPLSLDEIQNPTTEANLKNQYLSTVAQIMGTGGILIGLYYTGKSIKIAKEGQVAERFTKAIDQLENEKMSIRLGGIYALGKILDEFEEAYWPIIEILTVFIKDRAHIVFGDLNIENVDDKSNISLDVQASLTILGKRNRSELDLQKTYLPRVHLEETYFDNVNFQESRLIGAYFHGAHLNGANFAMTHLEGAYFNGAHLKGTKLIKAHLKKANFMEARLENALLTEADLTEANLAAAHLEGAHLKGADFTGADITGAFFKGAKLELEKIKKARGRTEAHFKGAFIDGRIHNKDKL